MTETQMKAKVLNLLRSKLGTGEYPAGSNHNFITEWYNKNVEKIGDGAWCEMTNTWSMWAAGFKKLKPGRAYTVYAAQDGQKGVDGSSFHFGTKGMKAGDHVYYDWSGSKNVNAIDHTGTVEKINDDKTFYALEGNCSDKLQRTHRDSKFVVGYVRSDWARMADKATNQPAKKSVAVKPTPAKKAVKKTASKQESKGIDAVKAVQKAVGVPADGKWGSATDKAVLNLRREHFNKF